MTSARGFESHALRSDHAVSSVIAGHGRFRGDRDRPWPSRLSARSCIPGSHIAMTVWFLLAAAAQIAANALASRADERRATPRLVSSKGHLPCADQVPLRDLGLHASKFSSDGAYVMRDIDHALVAALADSDRCLVLLQAPALSGASRTLAEALKTAHPQVLVAVPRPIRLFARRTCSGCAAALAAAIASVGRPRSASSHSAARMVSWTGLHRFFRPRSGH